jgi:hypothetical protein
MPDDHRAAIDVGASYSTVVTHDRQPDLIQPDRRCGRFHRGRAAPFSIIIFICLACQGIPVAATPALPVIRPAQPFTPSPAQTAIPSTTPIAPTGTPPAQTPTNVPTATTEAKVAQIFARENLGRVRWEYGTSPDGQWEWGIYERVGSAAKVTVLSQFGGEAAFWIDLPPGQSGLGADVQTRLVPLFWMPKDPYVYLTGRICCADSIFNFTGFNLVRLDLRTGAAHTVIPGSGGTPSIFSFSSIGQYLLVTQGAERLVRVIALREGNEIDFRLPSGVFLSDEPFWSPDETLALLPACVLPDQAGFECERAPLYLLDPASGAYRPVVADLRSLAAPGQEGTGLDTIAWISRNRVNLHMHSGLAWQLNLVTGELACQPGGGAKCP